MTYSLVGQAAGSGSALKNAGHYEFLRTIQHFACGQLNEDSYSGTGNGEIKRLAVVANNAPKETWTVTCSVAATDAGTFTVSGSTSGAQANATVGTLYDNGIISFLIEDGTTDFAVSDAFSLTTTNGIRTLYDDAFSGTGNGEILDMRLLTEVTETWTVTCTVAATNGGTFSVVGSTSGAQANATVGTAYDNSIIQFLIADGTTDFAVNDVFTLEAIAQELPLADRWLVKRFDDTTDDYELIIEGPGIVGVGTVFCQFKTVQSVAGDYYNIAFSTSQGYVEGNSWETQPNVNPKSCLMWNFNVPYYLRISPRQVTFSVDIEGHFDWGYVGHENPYLDPGQYPYPACQLGSLDGLSTTRYDNTTRNNGSKPTGTGATGTGTIVWIDGSFISPEIYPVEDTEFAKVSNPIAPSHANVIQSYTGTGNGTMERYSAWHNAPLETWTITATSATNFTVTGSISGAQAAATVGTPYSNSIIDFEIVAGGTAFVSGDEFIYVITEEYQLEQMVLSATAQGLVGELEGVRWITGFSNAVENTVTEGGETHIVIRDVARTGFNDYITMVLD
jgi:hypothetical protein